MRIRRQFITLLMTLGLMFAQTVALVHACPLLVPKPGTSTQTVIPDRVPMTADCAGMAVQPDSTSTANACEAHCNAGQQIDVHLAAWVAPAGVQPALTIRAVERGIPDARATIWLASLGAAPPRSLLFGHFLI